MDIIIERAIIHLKLMRLRPEMYASCREAFLAECSGILSIIDLEFDSSAFYTRHCKIKGNIFADIDEPVTKEWAEKAADDAIHILKTNKLSSFK